MRKKTVIMGAAGRDFHNFNVLFRGDPGTEVIAFTAAQIPFISRRTYPAGLAGPLYPGGIPIYPESELEGIIRAQKIELVVFSYSDLPYDEVMRKASLCTALGADFMLPGSERTMLRSSRPVISVCAVRTGCGKSGVTKHIARIAREAGKKPVVIRHPMPYGDLLKQRAQRFSSYGDIKNAGCTIEEMEEYEHLVADGFTVYAGVDYKDILEAAEKEAGLIIWDGGNNDLPFIRPSLEITVADPLRPGHEKGYYPGEANARRADCVVVNKSNSARPEDLATVMKNLRELNPDARIIKTNSVLKAHGEMKGKRVLVIEDGPTLTHGGMRYGAGLMAALAAGAVPVDARPYAVGSIRAALAGYPLENLLPAMGYSKEQIRDLEESVDNTPCDAVVVATPIDLARVIAIKRPVIRVSYEIEETESPGLKGLILDFLKRAL